MTKTVRRLWRRTRWRLRMADRRWPVLRRRAPLVLSLALNGAVALALLLIVPPRTFRGDPEAEVSAVDVVVVSQLPSVTPEEEPEPETPPEEVTEPQVLDEAEAGNADEEREEKVEDEDAPVAEEERQAAPPPPSPRDTARVDVPETRRAFGDPSGVLGLDCDAEFEDEVRARECAGAVITSDWRSAFDNEDNEQWQRAAERLRRGGNAAPFIGPDRYGRMGANQELYEPDDPRFAVPFDPAKRYQRAFATRKEYEEFLALQDGRTYIGEGGGGATNDHGLPVSEPISGWRPSWQLREDPDIDPAQMREFLKGLDENTTEDSR